MREGTCTHAGITYVIVNRNHTLRLHSLDADVESVHAVSALSGTQPTSGQTKFVVISVGITNHLATPQTVNKSGTQQLALILDGTRLQGGRRSREVLASELVHRPAGHVHERLERELRRGLRGAGPGGS